MPGIPASALVNITPSVLSAGGASLALNGLMLSSSTRIPIGANGVPVVLSFPSLASVQAYFGAASTEALQAAVYFGGFLGCTQFPSVLLVAQYPTGLYGAYPYLRGGNISGVPLTTLQTYSGVMTVTVNGTIRTSANINLSTATSLSNAASTIQTAFNSYDGVGTATIAQQTATVTGTIVGNVLTVTNVAAGTVVVGAVLSGTGGGGVPANCAITSQLTGTGGIGTYQVSTTQNVSSTAITLSYGQINFTGITSGFVVPGQVLNGTGLASGTFSIAAQVSGTGGTGTYVLTGGTLTGTLGSQTINLGLLTVTYDSTSGAFILQGGSPGNLATITQASGAIATQLLLTTATGATLSQGTGAPTPGSFMTALTVTAGYQNWATFWTAFNPDPGPGINTNKLAFAAWVNSVVVDAARFAYAAWDTDPAPTLSTVAASSLGYTLGPNNLNSTGTMVVYDPNLVGLAAFFCGMVASTNFQTINGRITEAYKTQTGLPTTVSNQTIAANLIANGYNFFGQYATANQNFNLWQPGSISGPFLWSDSYVNQIWLNNALQLALLSFLAGSNSVPYTADGYAQLEAVIGGVAGSPTTPGSAVYNGVISVGVPLTAAQTVQVNTAAGAAATAAGGNPNVNVAAILQTRGWYAQILPASGPVRAARTSPPMIFWYTDGGSIQQINLASIEVQ